MNREAFLLGFAALRPRRADDMMLYGTMTRIKKGRYEVVIKFTASKRVLHHEQLNLPTREAVKQFYQREYPTMTWGKPKLTRNPIARDVRSPKYRPRIVKSKKVYNRKRASTSDPRE